MYIPVFFLISLSKCMKKQKKLLRNRDSLMQAFSKHFSNLISAKWDKSLVIGFNNENIA